MRIGRKLRDARLCPDPAYVGPICVPRQDDILSAACDSLLAIYRRLFGFLISHASGFLTTMPQTASAPGRPPREFIRLDQFLKAHNLRSSGGAAKGSMQNGELKVDGATERRRGRKLYHGDTVECDGVLLRVEFDPA